MNADSQPSHRLLVDEPGLLLTQCCCCGEIELYFRGIAIALSLTDLYGLVNRLEGLPPAPRYRIGLLDLRDTLNKAGFQAIGLDMTDIERDRLLRGLHLACLRLDMDLLTRGHLPLN